jgi:hypothetical protein
MAFATSALVGFALLGGVLNYMWVNGMPGFLAAKPTQETPPAAEPGAPKPTAAAPINEG